MAMSDEERLARQRVRDTARRERQRAVRAAEKEALTPTRGEQVQLDKKGKQELYLRQLQRGLRRTAAAAAAGVHATTVRDWRRTNPDFMEAELLAEESAAEMVEDALFQSAMNGSVQAQTYWLENRAPVRWRNQRSKVDVQVTHTGQIEAGERLAALTGVFERMEARALAPAPDPNIIDVEVVG